MMNLAEPEVRYQMLRPGQIVGRRKECGIAYVPLGNVEWHGEHNATGVDTLQAEGLAIRAAQKGGGLVFPPLWYAGPRHETMEWGAKDREAIAAKLELPAENFTLEPGLSPCAAENERYQQLLVDILTLVETLGFKVGVLVVGHYPLISHALVAAQKYDALHMRRKDRMVPWACLEPSLRHQLEGVEAGDHAAGWETSNMMALYPETVDLKVLPAKGSPLVGVGGSMEPQDASAEFGRKNIEAASELMIREARHRLEHPDWYRGGSYLLKEGNWKEKAS
jgi:creatinine amidohydrolase